ncbi:MAG: hypothetical protein QOD50_1421 [Actinomycetota bacterium]|jgi:hypothetical protein|nr:hypothetical protein [Actinomycetota bacterium]
MPPSRVVLNQESKYELQEAITSLSGSSIDAYFALFEGGAIQAHKLSLRQTSKAPRAQALMALAERSPNGPITLADRFLSDRAKGKFGNATFPDLDRAIAENGLSFEIGRLVSTSKPASPKPKDSPHEHGKDARETTDTPRETVGVSAKDTPSSSGTQASTTSPAPSPPSSIEKTSARTVFLVQGRYERVNQAVTEILRALDLRVLTWEQAVGLTQKPNPHIEDVIAEGMAAAAAIVVLFTAEDRVQLEESLVEPSNTGELDEGHQPRPNVLIEAGMALAYDVAFQTQKTLIIQFGDIRKATDLDGKHVLKIGGQNPTWRHALVQRLRSTGLLVDDSDGNYLSTGNFPID